MADNKLFILNTVLVGLLIGSALLFQEGNDIVMPVTSSPSVVTPAAISTAMSVPVASAPTPTVISTTPPKTLPPPVIRGVSGGDSRGRGDD